VTGPLCAGHDQAVAMTRVSTQRFLRLVAPDGKSGEAVDTGTGPTRGLWACPVCGGTHPQLQPPKEQVA